jgi:hypothetical protein
VTIKEFLVEANRQKMSCLDGSYGTLVALNQHGVGLGEPIPAQVGIELRQQVFKVALKD